MKIENKTNMFQLVWGADGSKHVARPWRIIDVPEGTAYDESRFALVGETKVEAEPVSKKSKEKIE